MKYSLIILILISSVCIGQNEADSLCYSISEIGINHIYIDVKNDEDSKSRSDFLEFKGFGNSPYVLLYFNDKESTRYTYRVLFINGRLAEMHKMVYSNPDGHHGFDAIVFSKRMKVLERRNVSLGCTRMGVRYKFFSRIGKTSYKNQSIAEIIESVFDGQINTDHLECMLKGIHKECTKDRNTKCAMRFITQ